MRPLYVLLLASAALSASALAHVSPAPHFSAELPFHECDGLICIEVALDGAKPRTLLLDTGNINSGLTTEAANALGWKLEPIVQGGKTLPGMYRGGVHGVALGKARTDAKFLVLDRSAYGEHAPPADGAIAYTAFKDRILQIDYPHHVLRISDVITTPAKTDTGPAPGTLQLITFGEHGPPIVVGTPFTVDGKPVHAQIDTCYTGTLLVYDAAVDKLGLHKQGTPEFFGYTDGGVNMLATPAHSLGFGKRVIADKKPTLYFVGEGKEPVHQPDGLFEATVGNALFAHSVVTMDFHAMTLDVRPAG
ncbi:hypothetical protein [Dokdonella soli]|uniref:Aspartyl protease n=1 Tax=Dokdonella soli TaxID=529810 RepID=A0ABN1IK28_9GAMM